MVIAQPYVPPNSLTAAEPFCCTNEAKPERLAMLTETLRVSRAASHQAGKTHFTVFPEYSIPGTDGIDLIDAALEADDWPCSTVVIGGIDALDRTQYERLVEDRRTHVDVARNGAPRVPPHCWVNCAVVWVKTADGTFHRWVQPKLHPAWTEMAVLHEHMFRGSSVYIFKGLFDTGVPFRFGALVCFDWIAPIPAQTPPQWILADLHHQANGTQLPLSWLFGHPAKREALTRRIHERRCAFLQSDPISQCHTKQRVPGLRQHRRKGDARTGQRIRCL